MVFLRIETTNCDYPRVTFTFSGALWFLTESGRLAFFRPRPLNPFLVVHLANVLIPCTRTGIFGFVFREKLRLYSNRKSQCFNSLEHSSLFDITVYITMEGGQLRGLLLDDQEIGKSINLSLPAFVSTKIGPF